MHTVASYMHGAWSAQPHSPHVPSLADTQLTHESSRRPLANHDQLEGDSERLCFTLRAGSEGCTSLEQLCGGEQCRFAFMDDRSVSGSTCCPVATLALPPPPLPSPPPEEASTPPLSPPPSEEPSSSPPREEEPSSSPPPEEESSSSPPPEEEPSNSPPPAEEPSSSPPPEEEPSNSPPPVDEPSSRPPPEEESSSSPPPAEEPSPSPSPPPRVRVFWPYWQCTVPDSRNIFRMTPLGPSTPLPDGSGTRFCIDVDARPRPEEGSGMCDSPDVWTIAIDTGAHSSIVILPMLAAVAKSVVHHFAL
jgi:hypothetical protein